MTVDGGEACTYAGANGDDVGARLFTPEADDASGRALVLLPDLAGPDGAALAGRLAAAGFVCLLPDLWSREGAPPTADDAWEREAALPDRRALADVDRAVRLLEARDDVDRRAVGVLGLGTGGTLAFLSGCTSRDVAAVAAVGGRALYPELSPNKPTQPLELLLNLDRPLLALVGEADPALPAEHLELWRQKLDAGGKDHDLVVYPGAAPLALEHDAFERVTAFFEERL